MPAKARRDIMDPTQCKTYHITARCVRRAFLFGSDRYSRKKYDHRREWVEQRVRELAGWFAIDVLFVAWMANHFHLVLRNLPQLVEKWSDEDVIRRSCLIFQYKFRRMGVRDGEPTANQLRALLSDRHLVNTMRQRLSDPSWFMRQLNQKVARKANQEDDCTGRFFEGRFSSQEILDVMGLVICGIYADLNQIAAQEAATPEQSTRTSAYLRIQGRSARRAGRADARRWDGFLAPLSSSGDGQNYGPACQLGSARASDIGLLDVTLEDYLSLLDALGRRLRHGKRGRIDPRLPPILERLDPATAKDGEAETEDAQSKFDLLYTMVEQFDVLFRGAVGSMQSLMERAAKMGAVAVRRNAQRLAQLAWKD